MLKEYFKYNSLLSKAEIKETVDSLKLSINPEIPMSGFIFKLFDELKTISHRDSFELFFDICGTHIKISDTSVGSLAKLTKHIEDNDSEDDYEIELAINKKIVESSISIYFIEEFGSYLEKEDLSNILTTLSRIIDDQIYFEVFSTIEQFGTAGFIFHQANQKVTLFPEQSLKRQPTIELFNENASNPELDILLLPCDFNLLSKSSINSINNFFYRTCGVLSLIFISNSSSFKGNNNLIYKISGYKTVASDALITEEIQNKHTLLYKIFAWSYEGGNSSDKIGLVRNVLSIHLDQRGYVKFDNEVWEAIRSNYQIYLRGNIQSYLEVKNKIGEVIIESTTKTYAMADEILDSLKNNIFVLLTFLLTVVVVNGFKDNGNAHIFSNSYLAIVMILSLISGLWLLMTRIPHEIKK